MVCEGLEILPASPTIGDVLRFPTVCDPFFYTKIYFALFVIFTLTIYFRERSTTLKGDFMGAMGVTSIGIIVLAIVGTLVGFLQKERFIEIFVSGIVLIVFWLLGK